MHEPILKKAGTAALFDCRCENRVGGGIWQRSTGVFVDFEQEIICQSDQDLSVKSMCGD
jgi:hypothetical protein